MMFYIVKPSHIDYVHGILISHDHINILIFDERWWQIAWELGTKMHFIVMLYLSSCISKPHC